MDADVDPGGDGARDGGLSDQPIVNCKIDSDCDDKDPCTTQDRCSGGVCIFGPVDKDSDGDGYIDGACPGGLDCDDTAKAINLADGR